MVLIVGVVCAAMVGMSVSIPPLAKNVIPLLDGCTSTLLKLLLRVVVVFKYTTL